MADNILYKLRSGKPIKCLDFLKNFSGLLVPGVWYRSRLVRKLEDARRRPDYEYMKRRVYYYIRIHDPWKPASEDSLVRGQNWIRYS